MLLLLILFLFLFALHCSQGRKLAHVIDDDSDGVSLHPRLNLTKVFETVVHLDQLDIVRVLALRQIPFHVLLNRASCSILQRLCHLGPHLEFHVGTPSSLNAKGSRVTKSPHQIVPDTVLRLPPPGLDSHSCVDLADREHLAPDKDLYSSRIVLLQHLVSLLLVQ